MSVLPEEVLELGGRRVVAVGDRGAPLVVVILHGFQMEPADLSPFAHSLGLSARFLFPEAPLSAEPRGRAWWHIDAKARDAAIAKGPRDFAVQHPPDLPSARAALDSFLDAVFAEAGDRPVALCGFSQGAMLTCDTLLRRPRPVAAVALLSGSRLGFREWEPLLAEGRVRGLRMLVSHGATDPDLAFSAGEALRDCLVSGGADVTWVPFDQGHEIPLVVWRRLRKLLEPLTKPPRTDP